MTPAEIKHWRELAAIHTSRFPVLQLLDALEKANAKCDRLRAALELALESLSQARRATDLPEAQYRADAVLPEVRAALADCENQEGESK